MTLPASEQKRSVSTAHFQKEVPLLALMLVAESLRLRKNTQEELKLIEGMVIGNEGPQDTGPLIISLVPDRA